MEIRKSKRRARTGIAEVDGWLYLRFGCLQLWEGERREDGGLSGLKCAQISNDTAGSVYLPGKKEEERERDRLWATSGFSKIEREAGGKIGVSRELAIERDGRERITTHLVIDEFSGQKDYIFVLIIIFICACGEAFIFN